MFGVIGGLCFFKLLVYALFNFVICMFIKFTKLQENYSEFFI